MTSRRIDTNRVIAAIAVIGALLVAVFALTPALGLRGSGKLTVREAKKLFLTKKSAKRKFLRKKAADARFLDEQEAQAAFLTEDEGRGLFLTPAQGAARFEPASGETRINLHSDAWIVNSSSNLGIDRDSGGLALTYITSSGTARLGLPLPLPVSQRGKALALAGLEFCFQQSLSKIDSLRLYSQPEDGGPANPQILFSDEDNNASASGCLDYGPAELGSITLSPDQVAMIEINPDADGAGGTFQPLRTTVVVRR